MISTFFPEGIAHYVGGGILIGLAIGLLFLLTGEIGGMSTFFSSTWSYLSRSPKFRTERLIAGRNWRLVYALGLAFGGIWYLSMGGNPVVTNMKPGLLLLGGFLIGFGSRMGNGCTAGHGICGLALGHLPSLIAVLIFLSTAIGVAHLMAYYGIHV